MLCPINFTPFKGHRNEKLFEKQEKVKKFYTVQLRKNIFE